MMKNLVSYFSSHFSSSLIDSDGSPCQEPGPADVFILKRKRRRKTFTIITMIIMMWALPALCDRYTSLTIDLTLSLTLYLVEAYG
jgi:hypothetical protein